MTIKVTRKELEEALETYADLVEAYPDNESYLLRYAEMLQTLGREATATATLQHLHDIIAKRSSEEALKFAKKHPQIGRISLNNVIFDDQDKHIIAGKIIMELLGKIWLRFHRITLKEGQSVCRSDDLSDSVTLVIDGKVDAYKIKPDNTRVLVESIGSLDILGEHTFFTPCKMNIDAFVASEQATIVKIPRNKLQEMVESNAFLKNMLSQRALFRTNIHAIANNDVFRILPLRLSKYLARRLVLRHYDAGTLIYSLDQELTGIDIILSGQACYLVKNTTGKKVPLSALPTNSITGDLELKGKGNTNITELMAKTRVSIAHIPFAELLNVSVAFPPLKERLNHYAAIQQTQMMQHITQLNNL